MSRPAPFMLDTGTAGCDHGSQTVLPKRYVSRQLMVPAGDHRLLAERRPGPALLRDRAADRPRRCRDRRSAATVVPRLRRPIPGQPTGEELQRRSLSTARFAIVIDRERVSAQSSSRRCLSRPTAAARRHLPQVARGRLDRPDAFASRSKPRCPAVSRSRSCLPSGAVGSATARVGRGFGRSAS